MGGKRGILGDFGGLEGRWLGGENGGRVGGGRWLEGLETHSRRPLL